MNPDLRSLRMTTDEVSQIETALEVTIPRFLQTWFRTNPLADCKSEHRSLICDKDWIIDENMKLRKEGYYGRLWPKEYLWIGDDYGGGAYYVVTNEVSARVYWYDWEEGVGTTVDTINSEETTDAEFIREMKEDLE